LTNTGREVIVKKILKNFNSVFNLFLLSISTLNEYEWYKVNNSESILYPFARNYTIFAGSRFVLFLFNFAKCELYKSLKKLCNPKPSGIDQFCSVKNNSPINN